ncbi:hypothetical protein AO715_06185 [Xanthomonas sp. Mitacek01]|nr:hypothetical protein AO715_06185 [Xanthomonas sp. Mitacek01]
MRETGAASGFVEALLALSEYKPRLLFNALWAWGAVADAPRYVFGLVNAASMATVCSLAAVIAGRWFGAGRSQVWLLVAVILASRFGVMLYFDYLCGVIDTLSAALLLCAVLATARSLRVGGWGGLIAPTLLATATVLVHERYVAATFALGCVVAVWVWRHRPRGERASGLGTATALAIVPPVVFVALVWLIESRSVTTGTAGQEIVLGVGTLKVVATYLANVLLGTNFGHDWFVGVWTTGTAAGLSISAGFALLFGVLWGTHLWSVRRDIPRIEALVGLFVMIGALVVIASLPGEARQEARWMYPVAILVALAVFCSPLNVVRWTMLSAMLAVSLVHLFGGALDSIYNIQASRTARNLAQAVQDLTPPGRNALVMGMDHSPWTLGNDDGLAEFSRRNLGGKIQLRNFRPDADADGWADMAFMRIGKIGVDGERFAIVDGLPLDVLLSPQRIDALRGRYTGCTMFGTGSQWNHWRWSSEPELRGDGVVLISPTSLDGHYPVPVRELDGNELFYRARTANPARSSAMRLQVNWHDAEDGFLSTTIRVVKVTSESAEFSMPLSAPQGAAAGSVYASLHDSESEPVVLEEIYAASPVVLDLASGHDWAGWRWSAAPAYHEAGVVLEGAPATVGEFDASVSLLDRRLLVYRARTLQPGASSTLRLQVNWSDESGRFLSAQVELATITSEVSNVSMLVDAPRDAKTGTVYANLHDGVGEPVELQSIGLVSPRRENRSAAPSAAGSASIATPEPAGCDARCGREASCAVVQ